jgi:hypothetical protein
VPRTVNGTGQFFRTELKPHCDVSTNTSEGIRTGGEKRANPKLRPCPCDAEADGRDGRGEREGDEETIHPGDLRSRTRLVGNTPHTRRWSQDCGLRTKVGVEREYSFVFVSELSVSAKSGINF